MGEGGSELDRWGAPVPRHEAAARMAVPEGFRVALFAGEPDVRQPIAFTIDERGRLWVAECYSYPWWEQGDRKTGPAGRDRILVFEDADGDGRFDRRRPFVEGLHRLTGVEVGFGGVWTCATPHLLFYPDRDGDDVPDGQPEIVLDGWDPEGKHNVFNGLTWGPDGWLYGANGIMSNSRVGRPGTPDDRRVEINCGVWRYHPTRRVFETVAHGTTNPWGLDFDDWGEMFITNCVIPHLYHVIPGAHFIRMYGSDLNAHCFDLIQSHADHIHWAGGSWQSSRGGQGKHGEAGGGHAHAGAMIYLGDSWPERYRNMIFTVNLHGRRVNSDRLERQGSGYVARHAEDFLLARDDWFRGLELKYGPDGSVYMTDWSDAGECHENDAHGAHGGSGRIFVISYGRPRRVKVDLRAASDEQLVAWQLHRNDWYARQARRVLQERAASGRDMTRVHGALLEMFRTQPDVTRKLRALWALYVTGGAEERFLLRQLGHESEFVRAWAVRLLCDSGSPSAAVAVRFARVARDDPSPRVRLSLASALQRLPFEQRWDIAGALLTHAEDAGDHNLPLMIWYGVEPLVPADGARALELAVASRLPIVREYIARRLAPLGSFAGREGDERIALHAMVHRMAPIDDLRAQADLLRGLREALRGHKSVERPDGWSPLYSKLSQAANREVRELADALALLFDDPRALPRLRETVGNRQAETEERLRALQALVENRVEGLSPLLHELMAEPDPEMRGGVLRALAAYEDERTPRRIFECYDTLTQSEKRDAIRTLASRVSFAGALLGAIEEGAIPPRDVTAFTVRQLQALGDRSIEEQLRRIWGRFQPTSKAKAKLIAKYRDLLTPEHLKDRDLANGRLVFDKNCQQCHRLFDAGGEVGPDLTGSDRRNVEYVLENVLDPSAMVGRDYKLTNVITNDFRIVSGIVRRRTDRALTLRTINEDVVLSLEDIARIEPSNTSMMPEGVFETMTPDEIRDLVAYLASDSQVEPPTDREP